MRKTAPVSFADLAQLVFPIYVTALLDYFATGEGRTCGIYMLRAQSANELRKVLIDEWDEYFCQGCQIHNGLVLVPGYEDLIPERIRSIIDEFDRNGQVQATFIFSTNLHRNYS